LIPLSRFAEMLSAYKDQALSDWDEILMAARVLGDKPFTFTMDERGQYYMHAAGTLEECIKATTHHLAKLNKIQEQIKGQ
jgi:hypothetical protein